MMLMVLISVAAAAQLSVSDPAGCLDAAALEAELSEVDASVSVAVSDSEIALAATAPDGRTWSRTLPSSSGDCPHMAPVIARSVTRGLAELPALPDLTPEELVRPDALRPYRGFVGAPVGTSFGLDDHSVNSEVGARIGLRWDNGLTLTNNNLVRLTGDGPRFHYGAEVGWVRPLGPFSPEVSAGWVFGADAAGFARLSVPVGFQMPPSWRSILQVGPQLTVLQPVGSDESARLGLGITVQLLADRASKR